jgi:hypothetical protein
MDIEHFNRIVSHTKLEKEVRDAIWTQTSKFPTNSSQLVMPISKFAA